ncbi:MAG: hypothetical protein IRZ08_22870 [Frankia sp.]|nr:hypothetical protein [Frankia sp.]
MATGVVTGSLRANSWTRVRSGWGYLSIDYGISTADPGGEYRAYTAPLPFPISSGPLPDSDVTFRVIGYGSLWLWSPVDTRYQLVSV